MRIAIAYPPLESAKGVPLLTQNRQFQWFSRPTYIFPVVPATAATMLKRQGCDVLFLDGIARGMSPGGFKNELAAFNPDLVVMETKTPVVKRHWRWTDELKSLLPGAKVALCGDHVTALPAESMQNCKADFILTGGDWDFLLSNMAASGLDPAGFEPGVWYRKSDGSPADTGPFVLDHDLDSAPWIDRDLVHWQLYSRKNGNFKRAPGTYIMAGRDCWHAKCTFCSWTTLYPKYRVRSVRNVLDEIETLVERYGVKEIMDDSGSFPAGAWLREFCEGMIARGLSKKVRIDCNMRFGRLGSEDYALMRKAGFRLVLFGVESANQSTLDRFCKALKTEDVEKGAAMASRAGLDVHLTFMFGHAWEGPAEIANTVKLARRLLAYGHAATLQCTLTIPYPGTPLFRELKEKNQLASLDWDDYDQRTAVAKTPLATEAEIKKAIRDVYSGFLQPRAIWHLFKRNLFDMSFYWRGLMYLRGHLLDFRSRSGGKEKTPAADGRTDEAREEKTCATVKFVNRVLLACMAAMAAAIALAHLSGTGKCPARALLGKECVLCGCTRDFFGLLRGETSFINPLSPWICGFLAFEIFWRAALAARGASRRVAIADAVLHAALGAFILFRNFAVLFS